MAYPQSGYSSTDSRSNLNLEMLVFLEGGKPEYPEKNPRSKDGNQQQTQPTYDVHSGNQTRATLVEGSPQTTAPSLLRTKSYIHF